MSLYDDIDTDKKSESLSGWASGIKFLQSHMQLKKATVTQVRLRRNRIYDKHNLLSAGLTIKAQQFFKIFIAEA